MQKPKSSHKSIKHSKAPKKAKSANDSAGEPMKMAKKAVMPLAPTPKPAGNPQMKWNPAKKPKSVATDRGNFGFK